MAAGAAATAHREIVARGFKIRETVMF